MNTERAVSQLISELDQADIVRDLEGRKLRLARNMIRRYERATGDRKAKLHKRYEVAMGTILAAQLRKD